MEMERQKGMIEFRMKPEFGKRNGFCESDDDDKAQRFIYLGEGKFSDRVRDFFLKPGDCTKTVVTVEICENQINPWHYFPSGGGGGNLPGNHQGPWTLIEID